MLKSIIAVSAGLVGGAHAFWRMECPGRVGVARIDPIVDPGTVSKHAHSIHGSSAFAETVTSEELINGDCTSCRVTQDKSAYWHPALYFKDSDTGEFELVKQVGGMLAYYLLYGDNITTFPTDFRMLSGTNERRSYGAGDPSKPDPEKSLWESLGQTNQDTLAERALGFNCLNYAKDPEGTLYRHYLPNKEYLDANCKDGIRFEIMFPSCWKGGDETDSDDHKSHVAFPDLVMTGTCPDKYPVRLPSLMYEIIWDTASYSDRNGQFVIANGDTTGYGFHADFIMGWDTDLLQSAIDTCTSDSGRIEDCSVFNVVDEDKATSCEMELPNALVKEDIKGPMSQLPGDVQITYEDGADESASEISEPTSTGSVPTLTYTPGKLPSNSASPLPGEVFKESVASVDAAATPTTTTIFSSSTSAFIPTSTTTVPYTSSSAPALGVQAVDTSSGGVFAESAATTPAPSSTPVSETVSYYSTEFITNGNIVSKILWEEQLVYVTELEEETVTVTVTSTAVVGGPAARRRRRGVHMHGHGHRHI